MQNRTLWAVIALIGLVTVSLTLFGWVDAGPSWIQGLGYLIFLLGVCGFIWSWIVEARRARRPGDDRYNPPRNG
ncbi:hypothetical protein BCF33_0623 [Hasllibacter halocynthiae]|uniref:Uncharacterized protein n=1 Tax=Hasllibacter halocynthiae TaxID=595589 RepID=A0A2T0X7T3_9RHOB|nr:hypothetical protein [Hasllibacter halocynthiae]PRY95011.1 hypothetical protein BCF33_0623 [Hasllibacter halocynthiae]